MINRGHFQKYVDLHQADIDPEMFAAALAIQYVSTLLANGGSVLGRLNLDSALHPHHIEVFLARVVMTAQKNQRFEREWCKLQQMLPQVRTAWEKGQAIFQKDLTHAVVNENEEDMEYLSQIDFAADCYAYASARKVYPHNTALEAWFINGYMVAWQQYFLCEEATKAQSLLSGSFGTCS
jgi:hypothetical protein